MYGIPNISPGLGSSIGQVLIYLKLLNTSSTFMSSTSTSTHIKIFYWSLISIPWYIDVVWIQEMRLFPDYFFVLNKLINCILSYTILSYHIHCIISSSMYWETSVFCQPLKGNRYMGEKSGWHMIQSRVNFRLTK